MTNSNKSDDANSTNLQHFQIPKGHLPPRIARVTQEGSYGLILVFNDGTYAMYPVEELLELRPHRATVEER